jgi:hypothetical protein
MNEEDKIAVLNATEEPFARVATGIVRGCVGAVDGLVLRVRRPPRKKKKPGKKQRGKRGDHG